MDENAEKLALLRDLFDGLKPKEQNQFMLWALDRVYLERRKTWKAELLRELTA